MAKDPGKMKRMKRAKLQRKSRLAGLIRRTGGEQNLAQLARALGVSPPTISKYLKEMEANWQAACLEDIDHWKREELARIDETELAAWAGYQRTVGEHTKTTTKESEDGTETSTAVEELAGDPRFLSVIAQCRADRRAILGLDAERAANKQADALDRLAKCSEDNLRVELKRQLNKPEIAARFVRLIQEAETVAVPVGEAQPTNGNGGGNGNGGSHT